MTFRLKDARRAFPAVLLTVFSVSFPLVFAQAPGSLAPASNTDPLSSGPPNGSSSASGNTSGDDRIFGVIPNFLTVEHPEPYVAPLTPKQKFELFAKETFDPFTFGASAAGAAISQIDNDNPKYGRGAGAYADRFGAAVTDVTTQNFFQDAILASWWHEDPRYFRRGPEYHFWYRVGYALSRVVVTRTDAGKDRFNFSGIVGMSMGIALSNAYYPDASVNGPEVASRFGTSMLSSALSNILPEFWPDIHDKLFRKKSHAPNTAPATTATPAPPGD